MIKYEVKLINLIIMEIVSLVKMFLIHFVDFSEVPRCLRRKILDMIPRLNGIRYNFRFLP